MGIYGGERCFGNRIGYETPRAYQTMHAGDAYRQTIKGVMMSRFLKWLAPGGRGVVIDVQLDSDRARSDGKRIPTDGPGCWT
jgi:hypothetical protein